MQNQILAKAGKNLFDHFENTIVQSSRVLFFLSPSAASKSVLKRFNGFIDECVESKDWKLIMVLGMMMLKEKKELFTGLESDFSLRKQKLKSKFQEVIKKFVDNQVSDIRQNDLTLQKE